MAEEVYQPGENEATVLQMKKAENIRLADILYLIQGTGIDRDRQMTLEQLRNFLQDAFNIISMRGTSSATFVGLDGVEVGGTDAHSKIGLEEASFVYGDNRIKISKDNLEINGNSFSLENGVISISGKNARVEIDGGRMRILSSYGILTFDADGVSVSDNDGNNRQVIVSKDRNGVFRDVSVDNLYVSVVGTNTSFSDGATFNGVTRFNSATGFYENASFKREAVFEGFATFNNTAIFNTGASFVVPPNSAKGFLFPVVKPGEEPQKPVKGQVVIVVDNDNNHFFEVYDGSSWQLVVGG